MLVLDEADRILDLGFREQLNSILRYLPSEGRQTLLFSATQTKSVKDLARLSLSRPEYVGVHDRDEQPTPQQLVQNYVVTALPDKLDMLWSFIKVSVLPPGWWGGVYGRLTGVGLGWRVGRATSSTRSSCSSAAAARCATCTSASGACSPASPSSPSTARSSRPGTPPLNP
jgi:hypothetical protein